MKKESVRHYPLFLNLRGKQAAVFGAGKVAFRKIKDLLAAGAEVKVFSQDFLPEIKALSKKNQKLKLISKISFGALIKNAELAFAATSDREANEAFAQECRRRKVWVNVADQPELCDFWVPSSLRKGKLEIAISTNGSSPLLARKLREELESQLRPEAIQMLNRLASFRKKAKKNFATQEERRKLFEEVAGPAFRFLS